MTLDGSLISTGELAARLRVSEQTVRNYARRGMPRAGRDGRGFLFDEKACRAWVEANASGTGRGGKREGAGRKNPRKRKAPGGDARGEAGGDAVPTAIEARAEIRRRAVDGDPKPPRAVRVAELLNVTEPELRALVALAPEESHLSKAEVERLKTLQEARRLHRIELTETGKLVDADEVRREFAAQLAAYRERLETLPQRLTRAVIGIVGSAGGAANETALREAMTGAVERMMAEVAGGSASGTASKAAKQQS